MKEKKLFLKGYLYIIWCLIFLFVGQIILSSNYFSFNSNILAINNFSELSGNGKYDGKSEENAYKISSAEDFKLFADRVNGGVSTSGLYFELTKSIDLEGYTFTIGTNTYPFKGTFNGNNNMIINFKPATSDKNMGLFSYFQGTLKNLIIYSGNISCYNKYYVGAFVGYALNGSTLSFCINKGCTVNVIYNNVSAGGIVGYLSRNTKISNCANYSTVTIRDDQNAENVKAGGIVGESTESTTILECFNKGNVTVGSSQSYNNNNYAGGILGYGESSINNCYNTAIISASDSTYPVSLEADSLINQISGLYKDNYNYDTFGQTVPIYAYYEIFFSPYNYVYLGRTYSYNTYAGGIAGKASTITNCYNTGYIEGGKSNYSQLAFGSIVLRASPPDESSASDVTYINNDVNFYTYKVEKSKTSNICPNVDSQSNNYGINKSLVYYDSPVTEIEYKVGATNYSIDKEYKCDVDYFNFNTYLSENKYYISYSTTARGQYYKKTLWWGSWKNINPYPYTANNVTLIVIDGGQTTIEDTYDSVSAEDLGDDYYITDTNLFGKYPVLKNFYWYVEET